MQRNGSAAKVIQFKDPRAIVGKVPFPVWIWRKEVKIKGEMLGWQMISIMKATGGIEVGRYAESMIKDPYFRPSSETQTRSFACCEIGDLGFSSRQNPTTIELMSKVNELGYLCPMDAGPHLRYQFMDQKADNWALVAMEPIPMTLSSRGVFFLGCNNGNDGRKKKLYIDGFPVGEKGRWHPKLKVIVACK